MCRYVISLLRKLGATIFLLPQDIVEVKPKMILTFVGAILALESNNDDEDADEDNDS